MNISYLIKEKHYLVKFEIYNVLKYLAQRIGGSK